jgi:hypothetical protein
MGVQGGANISHPVRSRPAHRADRVAGQPHSGATERDAAAEHGLAAVANRPPCATGREQPRARCPGDAWRS